MINKPVTLLGDGMPITVLQTKLWGTSQKQVSCAFCQTSFVYEMRRMAMATSDAHLGHLAVSDKDLSLFRAQRKLKHKLTTGVDPVICPHCQKLQPNMIWLLRRRALAWVGFVAIVLGMPTVLTALAIDVQDAMLPAWWQTYLASMAAGGLLLLFVATAICLYSFPRSGMDRALRTDSVQSGRFDLLTLPRVGNQQWLAVRPTGLVFPAICAGCGNEPKTDVLVPLANLSILQIPVCSACKIRCFRGRALRAVLPGIVIALCLAVPLCTMHSVPAKSIIVADLTLSSILGAMIAVLLKDRWIIRGGIPIQFRGFHCESDDLQIRFKTQELAETFIAHCLSRTKSISTARPESPVVVTTQL